MHSPMSERLAGNLNLGQHQPFHLFAGEAPIITDTFPVGADLEEYQVFALDATGAAVPHDPVTDPDAPEAIARGITCFAVDSATMDHVSGYVGGFFNHDALVWHASLTTLAARKAAFGTTSTVKIGRVIE